MIDPILGRRVSELGLRPEGVLAECISRVVGELRISGVTFVPRYYLGDEDFWTPDGGTSVNVPWFLATAQLWGLAQTYRPGFSRERVLMYLRHEAAHAFGYAHRLASVPAWRDTFGPMGEPYRDAYSPDPGSREFVRYLHRAGLPHYAQKHPDEDWAETFAAWLDPGSRWRSVYARWPVALDKLRLVDALVSHYGPLPPPNTSRGMTNPVERLAGTVGERLRAGSQAASGSGLTARTIAAVLSRIR